MNVIGRLIKGVFFSTFLLAFLSIALVVSYKYSQENRVFLSMSDAPDNVHHERYQPYQVC